MNMLNEEDIIREAQRLEHLKDLLTALRRRGYDNVICADDAHVWGLPINDKFRVEEEGEEYAYVVRTTDYECTTCGMKRHRVEVYNLADTTDHDSDPYAELNRAQHRSEEE
jgi:hypothetical protein